MSSPKVEGHPDAVGGPRANRFLLEVESEIIQANRTQIKRLVPKISLDEFRRLAKEVARLRAEYLAASLSTEWTLEGLKSSDLPLKRKVYEESLAAFEALERAIQRGYVPF